MALLLDTHHHLDFLPAEVRGAFTAAAAERGVRIVAQTLTPSAFVELAGEPLGDPFPGAEPLISLGFHPWHITSEAQADGELEVFAAHVRRTRFIGEIGLDFGVRGLAQATAPLQCRVLRRVLQDVAAAAQDASPGETYVLSVHAVRSASEVIDVLQSVDAVPPHVVPVFHRFSGSSDELTRLVRLGGYVSVHPQLLASKRGRAYLRQVPADRLLLESDLPDGPLVLPPDVDPPQVAIGQADALAASLRKTLDALSSLRGQDMTAIIASTQARLYGM